MTKKIISICAIAALLSGSITSCKDHELENKDTIDNKAVRIVLTEEGWADQKTIDETDYGSPLCKGLDAYYVGGTDNSGKPVTGVVCCGVTFIGFEGLQYSDCYLRNAKK
jgi:hypothetical protein